MQSKIWRQYCWAVAWGCEFLVMWIKARHEWAVRVFGLSEILGYVWMVYCFTTWFMAALVPRTCRSHNGWEGSSGMHRRHEVKRTELGKGTRSLLDNIRGLRHNSAILGLDHLNHNALLGLSDSFTVAAARAVAATVATVRAVAATVSAARAVAATVSATVTTGITRVVALAAACTF